MAKSKPRKILVIDEFALERASRCERLARWGFETVIECDAEQARIVAIGDWVDLVVARKAARRAGADAFVGKSELAKELMDTLEALVGLREQNH
jgi:hypothetical protein